MYRLGNVLAKTRLICIDSMLTNDRKFVDKNT
jgi:hypothetical protein